MEKAQQIRNKIKSAMIYPLVILLVSSAIMIFLMAVIIPKFEIIFSDLLEGRALPPLTLFVMHASERIQHHWLIILVSVSGIAFLTAGLQRFRIGRIALDSIKLSVPFFGNLTRMGLLARFARTLGTLMESGVPILHALNIAKETLNNEIVARAVKDMHKHIKEGSNLSAPIEAHRIFPPLFSGLVEVGEETGQLPAMLLKVADLYEDEVDHTVMALSSIIEPVLIVVLALVVGTIVIALFLPMVSIIGNLS
jgi:type IV pilus assembly protein PilC